VSQTLRLAVPLLLIAIIAGILWGSRGPQPLPPLANPVETQVVPDSIITVHVAGFVLSPGLVELAQDARVADAVAAAGGLRPGADTSGVNLAAPLGDGEQVVIPGPPDQPNGSADGRSATDGDGRVRINQATVAELETLPGVGPVLAQRILEFREEHGPFQTVEDLLDVPGIGEAKLASLRDLLIVP